MSRETIIHKFCMVPKSEDDRYIDVKIPSGDRDITITDQTKEIIGAEFTAEEQKVFIKIYIHIYNLLRSRLLFHPQMNTALDLILPDSVKDKRAIMDPRYCTIAHNIAFETVLDRQSK